MSTSPTGEIIVSRRGSSDAIVVAATAVAVVATVAVVAVVAFSERGDRAGEVGGDGSDDGWDIVDTLAIEGCTVRYNV